MYCEPGSPSWPNRPRNGDRPSRDPGGRPHQREGRAPTILLLLLLLLLFLLLLAALVLFLFFLLLLFLLLVLLLFLLLSPAATTGAGQDYHQGQEERPH